MPSRGALCTCVYFGIFLAAALFLAVPSQLSAQVVGATVSGTVADSSGAKVPGAEITITNVGTGIATTTQTKTDGVFVAPNLNPGNYEVSVAAKGFSTLVRKGVTLTVF